MQNTAAISGPGDLIKLGPGLLVLGSGNVVNTYTGQTVVGTPAATGGIVLRCDADNGSGPLGQSRRAIVNSGSTLLLERQHHSLEPITINGTGYVNNNLAGALLTNNGNATWGGTITVNPGASIGTGGGNLSISGIISGNTDLVKVGANTLTLQAMNTYTGNTYVNQGQLLLQNSGTALLSGTAAGSAGFVVNPNASLTLDNLGSNVINLNTRIAPTAALTLNGGSFNLLGGAGAGLVGVDTSETVGTIHLNSGNSTIQTQSGSNPNASVLALPTVNLIVTNLVRSPGATANFLGTLGGLGGAANLDSNVNKITFLNATSPAAFGLIGDNGGILPFATANTGFTAGGDFATYDFTNGSIAPFNGYVNSINNSTNPGDIVKLGVNEILSASKTITALLLLGGATVSEAGFTLTFGGGLDAILSANGNNTIIGGIVLLGGSEGIILSGAGSTTTINSTIAGATASGGLTISGTTSGAGTVNLPNPNTYAGNSYLASGMVDGGINLVNLNIGSNTSFSTGTIYFNAGQLEALAMVTLANNYQFNTSLITINSTNGNNNLYFTGNGTVGNTASDSATSPINTFFTTLTMSGSALTVFSAALGGVMSGPGALLVAGAGTGVLMFTGANTFTGGVYLTSATTVDAGNDSAFGTGVLALGGGATLVADNTSAGTMANSAVTINGNVTFNAGNLQGTSSANGAFTFGSSEPVTIATNQTITVNTTVTFNGVLGGPGILTVAGLSTTVGQGNLVLNGNNIGYTATLNLGTTGVSGSMGALERITIGNANALGIGPLTLENFELINNSGAAAVLTMPILFGGIANTYVKFSGANPITFRNPLPAGNNTLANTATFIVTTPTTIDAVLSGAGGLTFLTDNTTSTTPSSLSLTEANTFTGTITIAAGLAYPGVLTAGVAPAALTLSGLGTLANTVFNLDAGGSLALDNRTNSATYNPLRLPNGAATAINFNGGSFLFLGSNAAGALSSQPLNLATTTFVSGNSTIINVSGSGSAATSILSFGTYTRTLGATVSLQGGASGNQTLTSGTNLTQQISFTSIGNAVIAVGNTVNPLITTTGNHNLSVGQTVTITGVLGATGANGTWVVATVPTATTFTIIDPVAPGNYSSGGMAGSTVLPGVTVADGAAGGFNLAVDVVSITGVTNLANPTITTNTAHGLSVGQSVTISGVVGAAGVNGTWTVTAATATSFTINNPTVPGAYTGGGIATTTVAAPFCITALTTYDAFNVLVDNNTTPARSVAITAATAAAPSVISTGAVSPGLVVGQAVTISGVVGATGVNGTFVVLTTPTATTFTITLASAPGVYSSGGIAAPTINALLLRGDAATTTTTITATLNGIVTVNTGMIVSATGAVGIDTANIITAAANTGVATGVALAMPTSASAPAAVEAKVITKAGSFLTINTIFTGNNGLIVAGDGTLALTTPNINISPATVSAALGTTLGGPSYLGTTYLNGGSSANSGTLLLGNNGVLSTNSALTLINGTLASGSLAGATIVPGGSLTLTNTPVNFGTTLNNTGNSTITLGMLGAGNTLSTASLIFSGAAVAMNGFSTLLTIDIGNTTDPGTLPGVFFSGVLAANSVPFFKQGPGTLILSGNNGIIVRRRLGGIFIDAGVVNVQQNNAALSAADLRARRRPERSDAPGARKRGPRLAEHHRADPQRRRRRQCRRQ